MLKREKKKIDFNRLNWPTLRDYVLSCERCPLSKTRQQVVFGQGDQKAKVMFIGEGPGSEEDKQGLPFVGAAGKLLDDMLFSIHLNRQKEVYIANIVKCRPPENRNPTFDEVQDCLPYLKRQIAIVRPKLLVALGKVAMTYLLQTESAIGPMRQKLHDYSGIPLVVTYHPAYLLRSPREKRKSWDDFCFIYQLLRQDKEQ